MEGERMAGRCISCGAQEPSSSPRSRPSLLSPGESIVGVRERSTSSHWAQMWSRLRPKRGLWGEVLTCSSGARQLPHIWTEGLSRKRSLSRSTRKEKALCFPRRTLFKSSDLLVSVPTFLLLPFCLSPSQKPSSHTLGPRTLRTASLTVSPCPGWFYSFIFFLVFSLFY